MDNSEFDKLSNKEKPKLIEIESKDDRFTAAVIEKDSRILVFLKGTGSVIGTVKTTGNISVDITNNSIRWSHLSKVEDLWKNNSSGEKAAVLIMEGLILSRPRQHERPTFAERV